jgi:hypothetical protein
LSHSASPLLSAWNITQHIWLYLPKPSPFLVPGPL